MRAALEIVKKGIEKAPEISKQNYNLHMTLGHAFKGMKKSEEALAAFEKAEKINKKLAEAEKENKKEKKPAQ